MFVDSIWFFFSDKVLLENTSKVLANNPQYFVHAPVEANEGSYMFFYCFISFCFICFGLFVYTLYTFIYNRPLFRIWMADFKHGYNANGLPSWWKKFAKSYFGKFVL